MIRHLIGDDGCFGKFLRVLEPFDVEIAYAQISDLAIAHEFVQGRERFIQF